MIHPSIFRAYDIRGVVPDELDASAAYDITTAYAALLPKAKEIVVGRDYRVSSEALHAAVVKALRDQGRDVIDIGEVPTPVLYFGVAHYKRAGGIMITASHLAGHYNGLKLQKAQALPVYDKSIYKMRDMIYGKKLPKHAQKKGVVKEQSIVDEYMAYVVSKTHLKKKLKIVIDCGNGACGIIPEVIFRKLGCDVYTLYGEPDGTFPNHIADPHEEKTLVDLQGLVKAQKADLGFAFDGDGDRVGVVDAKGRIVPGDFILMMLARDVLKKKKGPVVFDIRASMALVEDAKKHGGKPMLWTAGHAYILDKIFKEKAVFGGEITGHMYFPLDYYYYDDGMYIALKVAELVSHIDNFPAYVDSLPRYAASPELFIECPDDVKFEKVQSIVAYLKKNKYHVNDIDGARIEFKNGWALIRAANTSPYIKCRMEGKTQKDLKEITKNFTSILAQFDLQLPKMSAERVS